MLVAAVFSLTPVVDAATRPTLPQTFDVGYAAPHGRTLTVNSGGNLQTALNDAQLGDTIVLRAGATFEGPFTLPRKTSGTGWIYIQSSAYASLPAPGNRVTPDNAAAMPRIVVKATGLSAIFTADGAHHFRFVGIEISPTADNRVSSLVRLGNDDTSTATLPNWIVFDRCYIHGDAVAGSRRGIQMNGAYIAVVDSYVADFKEVGADTQALAAWNATGPIKIVNNFLEGAGENIIFGGADSKSAALVPSDIEIRNNHVFKRLSWIGTNWTVKNLLEFKSAQRVLVANNTFENVWPAAQTGWAMLISPRNQDGAATWSVTRDITVESNVWLNVGQGLRVGGTDDTFPSLRTERVRIANNLIHVTGLENADGKMFGVLLGPVDLVIDHNTGFATGANSAFMSTENIPKADRFEFTNNIVQNATYGFKGTGVADGLDTLNAHFANYVFQMNAIVGGNAAVYPPNNFFPANVGSVRFIDVTNGNVRLSATSPYRNAGTDGKDLGANIAAILEVAARAAPSPSPPSGLSVE